MNDRLHHYLHMPAVVFIAAMVLLSGAAADVRGGARILLLETMPVPVVLEHSRHFIGQMEKMGYHQGDTLDLVVLKAEGNRKRAEQILTAAMKEKQPDVVVTSATLASQTAARVLEGMGIPLVFMTVSDPVGAKLIRAVGEPTGTNITGKVHMIRRGTRISMVMRLMAGTVKGRPVRIGFIHSSYPSAAGDIRQLKAEAAKRSDIEFISHELAYRTVPEGMPAMLAEAKEAVAALRDRVDAWWEPSGPLGEVAEYTRLLRDHSTKPIVMGTKVKSVEMGALLHLTPDIAASGRETAMLVDAILNGRDPGSIPPTPPDSFSLGVNLNTALQHDIVIPPDILRLAGDQVYR